MSEITTTVNRDPRGRLAGAEVSDGRTVGIVRDRAGRIREIHGERDPLLRAVADLVRDLDERTLELESSGPASGQLDEALRGLRDAIPPAGATRDEVASMVAGARDAAANAGSDARGALNATQRAQATLETLVERHNAIVDMLTSLEREPERQRREPAADELRWEGAMSKKELRRACKALGIARPVRVWRAQADAMFKPTHVGQHFFADGEHHIYVRIGISAREANRNVFHELSHAAQLEAEGCPWPWESYHAETKRVGYNANRYEQEARKAERLAGSYRVLYAGRPFNPNDPMWMPSTVNERT